MKILIVHYRYFISGGPERYLFNVKTSLEKRGHTVIPFSIKNRNNISNEYSEFFTDNIGNSDVVFVDEYPKTLKTYVDLLSREFYSFKVRKDIVKLIRVIQPDICYLLVYKRALSPSVVDACKKYGIPVVNRISDYNPVCGAASLYREGKYCEECLTSDLGCLKYFCVKSSRIFSLARFLSIKLHKILKIQKKISAYVCTNGFMADMMEQYGYDKTQIVTIPTFFGETPELLVKKKPNIVRDYVKFLFIGNIDESKGIYDLLHAVISLKTEVSNFHLTIVGGLHVSENEKVNKIVEDSGLKNLITLVPYTSGNGIFDYYIETNVTVIPARWVENLPNTLIESLFFQRPVVVPDYGSFRFTVDETVAFKYKALSASSLKDTLLSLCENPNLIAQKSYACEKYYHDHFSEEQHMNALLALFTVILEKCHENN